MRRHGRTEQAVPDRAWPRDRAHSRCTLELALSGASDDGLAELGHVSLGDARLERDRWTKLARRGRRYGVAEKQAILVSVQQLGVSGSPL